MGSKEFVRPPVLAAGSRVALVAPAGPLLEHDDLLRGEELCLALGFEPVLGPNAYRHYGYLAGTDEQRLSDLNAAIADPRIDAVWCLRGGYGVTRILEGVNFAPLRKRPKAIMGFSDITALLAAAQVEAGLVTFHAPMARSPLTPFSRWHFDRVLTAVNPAGRLGRVAPPADVLVPTNHRIVTLVPGQATGPLAGGNLTLLQCLIGTRYFPKLDGTILFIEDVGEALYSVDRMLAHLRAIGELQKVAGIVIGQFTELKRGTDDGSLGFDEVLRTYLAPLNVPVAYGFPIGHVDDQWTLPLGVNVRLDATAGEVEILDGAVR
jgi:muramoyltetrapeptide carboxypeptidase